MFALFSSGSSVSMDDIPSLPLPFAFNFCAYNLSHPALVIYGKNSSITYTAEATNIVEHVVTAIKH